MKHVADCEWVEERLSAYIDNELAAEDRLRIEEHCEQCRTCRELIAQFVSIGSLMRQSEPSVDVEAVWDKVAANLDNHTVAPATIKSNPRSWGYAALATAASIALIWFVARNESSTEHDGERSHEHSALAVDFQEVIEHAKNEPQTAITMLAAKYKGQVLDQESASKFLGYEPAVFQNVPQGFARVSTHGLNMPCCKCSATICQREDGTSLIVFEHKDEQPVWFGDSPSIETQCSGKTCKIIESAGQLAVSWKNDDRQMTLIGATDIAEVNQWVEQMKL